MFPIASGASEKDTLRSGIQNFQKGLYLKAIKDLQHQIRNTDTPSAENWFYLGSSFSKTGQFDQAINSFLKALKVQKDYPEAYLNLGIAYYNKKDYPNALSAFEKVLKKEPDNSSATFFLGLTLQQLKKPELAVQNFQKASDLDPDFRQLSQFNIGLQHFKSKRYEESIEFLKACIETDPESDIAQSARELLRMVERQKPQKPWQVSFRTGASIDDNITLSDINLTTGAGDSLTFHQFSGAYQWEPFESVIFSTGYDFSQTLHETFKQFDLQIHSGFLTTTKSFDDFDFNLGYAFNHIALGGSDFENLHTLSSGLSFEMLPGWFVDLSYFLTFKDFVIIPERDAENHSLRISNFLSLGDNGELLWLTYTPEGEIARDDQLTYVAHNTSIGVEYPLPLETLKTKLRASYSHIYQDYLFNTPLINTERIDFRNQVSFEIIQPILKNFDTIFQYQYINSESNLLANDFVENIFSLSVGARF